MNFGSVCIKLCSVITVFWVASIYAQQTEIPAHLQLKSTVAKEAYSSFIQRFYECGDKKARKNHPYPVNDWLLSLSPEKQASVVVYLYSLAESRCLESERNNIINTFKQENEQRALTILEEEGWLSAPVYGEFARSDVDKALIELSKDDKKALSLLTERHYKPFDGIGMGELLFKFRDEYQTN